MEKYSTAREATYHNITRRMPFACWVTKATRTQSLLVIHVFPRQRWLRERVSMLKNFTFLACLVFNSQPSYWQVTPVVYTVIHSFISIQP